MSSFVVNECKPGDSLGKEENTNPYIFINYTLTTLPEPVPTWEIALKVTFYVVAFLIDIVGNSTVILIIVINKRMRTPTNMLIFNLAVSDMLVGLACMWVHAGNSITTYWPFGSFVCKVNTFVQVVAVTSSVLTLTCISVERFFAIVYPLKQRMSPALTVIVVIINWILSIAMASPHLAVRRVFQYYYANYHTIWCTEVWQRVYIDENCAFNRPGRIMYYTVETTVMYFIPIFVMLCAYSMIAIKLINRKQPGSYVNSTTISQERAKKKVILMLIAVLTSFIICWTPQHGLILWDIYRDRKEKAPESIPTIKYIALYVAYLNSAINPILYGGFNENFRKGFHDAFQCVLFKKRNTIVPARSGSRNNQGSNTTAAGSNV